MNRPSRGHGLWATTTRYAGLPLAPLRVKRILTKSTTSCLQHRVTVVKGSAYCINGICMPRPILSIFPIFFIIFCIIPNCLISLFTS